MTNKLYSTKYTANGQEKIQIVKPWPMGENKF